ncbi:unnamed protein product, partial [marine sediment metagenome]
QYFLRHTAQERGEFKGQSKPDGKTIHLFYFKGLTLYGKNISG